MKKGFTLIEMLGIIAVLAVVLLVTFPVLNNSLKTMKEDQNKNFTNNLKISAEAYIELNRKNYPELDNSGSTTITIQDLYNSNLLKGQYEGVNTSNQIIITKKQDNTLEYYYVDPTKTIVYNFDYTGAEQEFKAPLDGIYKIETWGAQGGDINEIYIGGYGGYSNGNIHLENGEILYIFVGEKGANAPSNYGSSFHNGLPYTRESYNGGAPGMANGNTKWSGGGGTTHISKMNFLLKNLESYKGILISNLYYKSDVIIMVAGAGAGAGYQYSTNSGNSGGNGGGYIGTPGSGIGGECGYGGTGGSQIGGGTSSSAGKAGKFGYADYNSSNGAGGGSGFFAGAGAWNCGSSAGGGSGYIGNTLLTNKSMYCYDCEESNEISTFTVSTTGTSLLKDTTNCPDGYSESPIAKCAKAGNGYARITYLGSAM